MIVASLICKCIPLDQSLLTFKMSLRSSGKFDLQLVHQAELQLLELVQTSFCSALNLHGIDDMKMSNMYSTDVWRPGSDLITPYKEAPSRGVGSDDTHFTSRDSRAEKE